MGRKTVLTIILSFFALPAWGADAWLAFGEWRGHLGPCGCDPLTDLGGIRRLARFVTEERKGQPDLWLFDLGNTIAPQGNQQNSQTLLAATAALKPTATLLNTLEGSQWSKIRKWQKSEKLPLPPYVLSHGKDRYPEIAIERSTDKVVVLGFTEGLSWARPWSESLKKEWRDLLGGHKDKTKVLLFSGKEATLAQIKKAGLFDEVIVASQAPLTEEPTAIEKDEPGRLLTSAGYYRVPTFGQGVLRGGALRAAPALSGLLESCPAGSPTCSTTTPAAPAPVEKVTLFTWLEPSWEGPGPVDDLLQENANAAQRAFQARAKAKVAELPYTRFAGAEACAGCHASAYKTWAGSAHAHALATLKNKGKDQDLSCTTCHVLGQEVTGGFVSEEKSPQFANVQCESCHGPRLAHAKDPKGPSPQAQKAREMCASCHNATHSPRFNFPAYWQKIKHP